MRNALRTCVAILVGAFLLAGCPTTPVNDKSGGTGAGAGVDDRTTGGSGARTSGIGGGRGGRYTAADLNDPTSPLYQRVIYFDYDKAEILPQFVDILRAHAQYLGTGGAVRVTLEGHTDERGSREYNLALGDQRAETVQRFLRAEGVAAGQIDTLSYGEERPADPGHEEAYWALNRRVELIYQ